MKKISKRALRLLSLVLSVMILASLCAVTLTANAADTAITVYYTNKNSGWSNVNAYVWPKGGDGAVAWPGAAMENMGEGIFKFTVPAGNDMIIFNNGGAQTDDLAIPGDNYICDGVNWEVYDVSSVVPVISVSKKNGSTFKSETLDVNITVSYADSATYSVDGGAAKSFTDSTTVTLGAGVAVNSSTTLTVTATNANGTTTESYTYTKKEAGVIEGDGSTIPALDGYFSTNPNGQVGKQASITIDGSISDWDSSMLIAQGVANDDPRVYRPNSMYEIAMDDYALYAAWDNSNLYLMWEMSNVQDAVAPLHTYPISQGNLWINNMPVFLYISTDPSIEGDGTVTSGATVWDSGITLDANIDTVVAFSTNGSNGPFVYKADDDGKIVYNETRLSSIQLDWGNEVISTELWGIDEGYGEYNNRIPGDVLDSSSNWIDFYKDPEHSKSIDMFYEMAIPFDVLGISASELTSNGIGLIKVSTFGTSGMNSLPADPSMWDNAHLDYSGQEPNSREKEDEDHITVPLARVGKMLNPNPNPNPNPTTPTPTNPTPTQPVTDPVTPTTPDSGSQVLLGDSDKDGVVTVLDATYIQKLNAQLISADKIDSKAADVDGDGIVTVLDATLIQKFVAELEIKYPVGQYVTK